MTTAAARTTTLQWANIAVGDEVTPLEGSPNLFMNILTTNGYCVRFLTDWAGPEAMVKNLSIRLGVSCFPDDPLRFTGSVTETTEGSNGENFIKVAFKGSNSLGDHVSGTAVLSLLDGVSA